MNRRGFLRGLGGIFAAATAPAFIHNAMPIRRLDGLTEFIAVDSVVTLRDYILRSLEHNVIQIYSGAMPATPDAPVDPSRLLISVPAVSLPAVSFRFRR